MSRNGFFSGKRGKTGRGGDRTAGTMVGDSARGAWEQEQTREHNLCLQAHREELKATSWAASTAEPVSGLLTSGQAAAEAFRTDITPASPSIGFVSWSWLFARIQHL